MQLLPSNPPAACVVPAVEDEDDLADAQIEQLLRNAEARLGASSLAGEVLTAVSKIPALRSREVTKPYINTNGQVARTDSRRLLNETAKLETGFIRQVQDPKMLKEQVKANRKADAGSDWFNLPRTTMTPELKRDLQLLKMRSVLDPKRFYKKESAKAKPPDFCQVGTIIEGNTEYFNARIKNKDRKQTLVEEVLAGEKSTGWFKSKYNDVQVSKASGKKGYYKALKAKRSKHIRK